MNPVNAIKESFIDAIHKTFGVQLSEDEVKIENPPNPEFGDLGIPCFPLAKALKKSPAQIATKIEQSKLPIAYAKEIKAVGPFLNLFLDGGAFLEALRSLIDEEGDQYGENSFGEHKEIMVEYSAPNTNKPQHLGHVRNNVLGMAVSNLLKAAGYNVLKVNLVNDRGIHICKSMLAYDKWGENATPESTGKKGDHFVGDFYVLFDRELEKDPNLIDEAQAMLQKWEEGDKDVRGLWKKMDDWVMDGFKETYDRMGCEFDKIFRESETYTLGKDIALKALAEGNVRKNESGDIVVDLEGFETDEKVLLRRDGTSIYITQDLGTTVMKFKDRALEKAIWVVASEQNFYFKILFYVLKKLGYEWAEKCFHLGYGMVYLPEGKMKSREGKVVDADNLMDELHDLARKEILERAREMDERELEEVSEAVALGALKYYILKVNPFKDINFSPEESVSFEGATGPYGQYSYARLSSILRKAKKDSGQSPDFSQMGNAEEIKLSILLAQYPAIVLEAAINYNPAKIAAWIFDASKAINKFHHDHSVLQAETPGLSSARVKLVESARQVIGNAMRLLGITPLERM